MKLVLAIKYLDIKYFLCNLSQPTFMGEFLFFRSFIWKIMALGQV